MHAVGLKALHRHSADGQERGQIIVLFALVLVLLLMFAGLVADLGMLANDRQQLVNTMDAGALAGGTVLPVDGDVAPRGSLPGSQWTSSQALIQRIVAANYPGLAFGSGYTIEYRCLIGVDGNNQPFIARDIPAACSPAGALGHAAGVADFVGAGATRSSPCDPTRQFGGRYDKCNLVVVRGRTITPFVFGPAVGIDTGTTGVVQSAACNGPCGAPPAVPVDVVLVLDRTLSMQDPGEIAALQNGANTVLSVFNPALQRVALGAVGPSVITGSPTRPTRAVCPPASTSPLRGSGQVYGVGQSTATNINFFANPTDIGRWIPVGFTGTDGANPPVASGWGFNQAYSANGVPVTTSEIWKAISCIYAYTQGTNLDTPISMAQTYLTTYGRPGVKKVIIFETDGTPQAGDGSAHYTCNAANNSATAAKSLAAPNGVEIYTIGFGIQGATCPQRTNSPNCSNPNQVNSNESAAWSCKPVSTLLQSMASPDVAPGQQHFFNAPTNAALIAAFSQAASQIASGGTHLVQLYPTPIVTGVGPGVGPSAGGTPVTISGQYFTGVSSVSFGGRPATVLSFTDTTISVLTPVGPANTTVSVVVRTGGGVSVPFPNAAADDFRYGP